MAQKGLQGTELSLWGALGNAGERWGGGALGALEERPQLSGTHLCLPLAGGGASGFEPRWVQICPLRVLGSAGGALRERWGGERWGALPLRPNSFPWEPLVAQKGLQGKELSLWGALGSAGGALGSDPPRTQFFPLGASGGSETPPGERIESPGSAGERWWSAGEGSAGERSSCDPILSPGSFWWLRKASREQN